MRRIYLFFYYLFAYNLPSSKFSKIFNLLRVFLLNKILQEKLNLIIERRVYISSAESLVIGDGCEINENVFIQGAIIGCNVLIAPNVAILSKTHSYLDPSIPIKHQGSSVTIPPEIGNDVWIGRNVVILPGVKIDDGVVIGAGSVVTHDLKSYSVYGGVPARFIKKRMLDEV